LDSSAYLPSIFEEFTKIGTLFLQGFMHVKKKFFNGRIKSAQTVVGMRKIRLYSGKREDFFKNMN
jgi:hypothetical protein